MTSVVEAIGAFETQAEFCDQLGSPLTARILRSLAKDIEAHGPMSELLQPFKDEPVAAALALRVAGAFHRRALDTPGSDLANLYPTAGGDVAEGMSDRALRTLLISDLLENFQHYQRYLDSPPQTNEVGRSAVLIGGYLTIAEVTGLPLHVFEIGASAGLNLGCDRFFYQFAGQTWGDASSPVSLAPDWYGGLPPLNAPLRIVERAACDIAPINIHNDEASRRLESYIWADQPERLARLRGAVVIAKEQGIMVERLGADVFVRRILSTSAPAGVRVIAHSVMWQYMPEAVRASIEESLRAAGESAREEAPVAWLRLEPIDVKDPPHLRLTLWPGGGTRDLAIAHPHGASVKWF